MRTIKRIGNLLIERVGENMSFMIVYGYRALETSVTMQGVHEIIQALRAEFISYIQEKPCRLCKHRMTSVCRECSVDHEKFEPSMEVQV